MDLGFHLRAAEHFVGIFARPERRREPIGLLEAQELPGPGKEAFDLRGAEGPTIPSPRGLREVGLIQGRTAAGPRDGRSPESTVANVGVEAKWKPHSLHLVEFVGIRFTTEPATF